MEGVVIMSRPRHYWYGIVKKMVMQYPELKNDGSKQAAEYVEAINKCLEDTRQMDEGENRLKAIDMVYFKKTETKIGAANILHYSDRTITRWLNSFVNAVGRQVGF